MQILSNQRAVGFNLCVCVCVCVQTSVTMHVCVLQVEYYIQATDSDNHAVREAACACIAELGSKVWTLYN